MIPIKLDFNRELSGAGDPSSSDCGLLLFLRITPTSGNSCQVREADGDFGYDGGGSTAAGLPHGTAPACGRFPGPMTINNAGARNLTRGRAGAWDGASPGDSALGTSRYTF